MSASKKLEMLDADLQIFGAGRHWVDLDGPNAGTAVSVLKDALPQIVALVDAVERALDEDFGDGPPTLEIDAALTALDEVLNTILDGQM